MCGQDISGTVPRAGLTNHTGPYKLLAKKRHSDVPSRHSSREILRCLRDAKVSATVSRFREQEFEKQLSRNDLNLHGIHFVCELAHWCCVLDWNFTCALAEFVCRSRGK